MRTNEAIRTSEENAFILERGCLMAKIKAEHDSLDGTVDSSSAQPWLFQFEHCHHRPEFRWLGIFTKVDAPHVPRKQRQQLIAALDVHTLISERRIVDGVIAIVACDHHNGPVA